jgi:hypothetical protein
MRADQISISLSMGWWDLAVAYLRSQAERWIGGRWLAVPPLPGRAERFRLPGLGQELDFGFFWLVFPSSPYPSSRRYRRR